MSFKRALTLGVLGGGQLGRMLSQAAQQLGFKVLVLSPNANDPAVQLSDGHILANYDDKAALLQLARECIGITTEFENVPASSLEFLASTDHRLCVTPRAMSVLLAQDRIVEKQHFEALGIATAPYRIIDSATALNKAMQGAQALENSFFPAILKTARLGYDGKGQVTVRSRDELLQAWQGLGEVVCVLEQRLALWQERSVLLARQPKADGSAQVVIWPVQRNWHQDGILRITQVLCSAEAASDLLDQALREAAKKIAHAMDYHGVLCVEFFILEDGSWVVNEMAPRPHNSGHITMDASALSQFEAQARLTANWPLTPPRQHSSGVMLNILGDAWFKSSSKERSAHTAEQSEPAWSEILRLGADDVSVHLHLYGKERAALGRKMGHINITADTPERAWQTAQSIQQLLQ